MGEDWHSDCPQNEKCGYLGTSFDALVMEVHLGILIDRTWYDGTTILSSVDAFLFFRPAKLLMVSVKDTMLVVRRAREKFKPSQTAFQL